MRAANRRRVAPLLAALLALAAVAAAQADTTPSDWPDPTALSFEPLDYAAPEPTRVELANGVVVYLSEDHSLPLVEGVAYVPAKATYDPEGEAGLASFTADLLREGGAGDASPEALDERLEFLAASVETGANASFSSVSFSALAENVDEVIGIWHDVLVEPRFDEARIEIERQRQLEAIRRLVDNPVQLAVREFTYRVAEGHPAGAFPTEESVTAIARDDLVAFHERYYRPRGTVMALSGDFDTEAMVARLEAAFDDWRGEAAVPPELPDFDPNPAPRVYYLPKDLQQSVILIGHPGVFAYTPEYNDLTVANDILGAGGFTSRLFTEIRTRRGLAYSTSSSVGQGFDVPGTILYYAFSRADATGQVIELLLSEVRRLQDEGVAPAELEASRQRIVNSSIFRDVSVAAVTQRTARAELLGLEPGYYQAFLERVQSITPDEVQQAARAGFRTDDAIVLVVGNAELFDRPLSDFGEVVTIETP